MSDVLIILGSGSDLAITDQGLELLKKFNVSFSLRIASAHRSPDYLEVILGQFEKSHGKVVIAVAGKSAHLAGMVAAKMTIPVIAVPVYNDATAGFDALLSTSQMPTGVPVGTMGFGETGFSNGCLFAMQILSLHNNDLHKKIQAYRHEQTAQVKKDDEKYRLDFP